MEKYKNAYRTDDGAKTVACVMMDPRNGEILAMASNRKYDLNQPYDLVANGIVTAEEEAAIDAEAAVYKEKLETLQKEKEEVYSSLSEEEQKAMDAQIKEYTEKANQKYTLLNEMWRNFCVSDTYEPGSNVKPMVVAAALESGIVSGNEEYYCDGAQTIVAGEKPIHCAKRTGHGMITLEGSLMFSCNDALMQMSYAIGVDNFTEYQSISPSFIIA